MRVNKGIFLQTVFVGDFSHLLNFNIFLLGLSKYFMHKSI